VIALAGRQVSEMAPTAVRAAVWAGGQGARHLDDLPEGYHATGRGQAWQVGPGGRDAKGGRPL
jgi:hypothetical protein